MHSLRNLRLLMIATAVVVAIPGVVYADDKCANADDQAMLGQCADASFEKSDKKLNHLYKEIESRLKDDADTWKRLVQHSGTGANFATRSAISGLHERPEEA